MSKVTWIHAYTLIILGVFAGWGVRYRPSRRGTGTVREVPKVVRGKRTDRGKRKGENENGGSRRATRTERDLRHERQNGWSERKEVDGTEMSEGNGQEKDKDETDGRKTGNGRPVCFILPF